MVENPPAMQETWVWSLGWEDPLEEGMETHSSIFAWRILMDRRAWWLYSPWVCKELDTIEQLSIAQHTKVWRREGSGWCTSLRAGGKSNGGWTGSRSLSNQSKRWHLPRLCWAVSEGRIPTAGPRGNRVRDQKVKMGPTPEGKPPACLTQPNVIPQSPGPVPGIGILLGRKRFFVCSVTQLCQTLCDSLDCSPPGSSVHGIL